MNIAAFIFLSICLFMIIYILFAPLVYKLECIYNDDNKQLIAKIENWRIYKLQGTLTSDGLFIKLLLFGFKLPLRTFNLPRDKHKNVNSPNDKKTALPSVKIHRLFEALMDKHFMEPTLQLIKDLLIIIKPRNVQLAGQIGFDEPHYTAWLMALLGIITSIKGVYKIDVEPIWNGEFLNIDLLVSGKITLSAISWRFIRYLMLTDVRFRLRQLRAF